MLLLLLPNGRSSISGRHAPVVDGRAVVEIGAREVFISCRSRQGCQPEISELALSLLGNERDHAPALKVNKQ